MVATPTVIHLAYGSEFESSVKPARILLLSILPWSLWMPKASELASVGLEKRTAAALAVSFVLDVVLVAALGHSFGATGAAWAWVISQCATLLLLSLMSRGIADRASFSAQGPPPLHPFEGPT
jgi:O-antigen/teichoic acid export membrane protein